MAITVEQKNKLARAARFARDAANCTKEASASFDIDDDFRIMHELQSISIIQSELDGMIFAISMRLNRERCNVKPRRFIEFVTDQGSQNKIVEVTVAEFDDLSIYRYGYNDLAIEGLTEIQLDRLWNDIYQRLPVELPYEISTRNTLQVMVV